MKQTKELPNLNKKTIKLSWRKDRYMLNMYLTDYNMSNNLINLFINLRLQDFHLFHSKKYLTFREIFTEQCFWDKKCIHNKLGGLGTICNEMTTKHYKTAQWGIRWQNGANTFKFNTHYYWNDKKNIRILGLMTFKELCTEFNFGKAQAEFLLGLCDNDLVILETLFFNLSNNLKLNIPYNKQELNSALNYKPFKSWKL